MSPHYMNVIEIQTCTSTNDEIVKYINKEKNQSPTLLISQEQTAGKGQRGKQWLSPKKGGWYFSLHIPFLNITSQMSHFINWVVLKNVLHYFSSNGLENIQFKWPNDLYTDLGKLGGVLVENQLQGTQIKSSIIGVGINEKAISVDSNTLGTTSLEQSNYSHTASPKTQIMAIADAIIHTFQMPLLNLEDLKNELWQYAYGKNRSFSFDIDGKITTLKVKDMNEKGFLVLENAQTQEIKEMQSGSIIWLNEV